MGIATSLWACGFFSSVQMETDIWILPETEGAFSVLLPLPKIHPFFLKGYVLPEHLLVFHILCEQQNLICSLQQREKESYFSVQSPIAKPLHLYFPATYSKYIFSPFLLVQHPTQLFSISQAQVKSYWKKITKHRFSSAKITKSYVYLKSSGGNIRIDYHLHAEKRLLLGSISIDLQSEKKRLPALGKQPLYFKTSEQKKLWL